MNKRIAIVITGMSFGGAERVTAYLANYFATCGRDVYLISLTKTEPAYPLSSDVHYIQMDESKKSNTLHRYGSLIRGLRRHIKTIKPNVVLGMMSYSGTLAAIACFGLKIPFIISERNDPNTSTSFGKNEKKVIRFAYHHLVTSGVFQSKGAMEYYYRDDSTRGTVIPNPLYLDDMPSPNPGINESKQIISAGRLSVQKNHALLIEAFELVHAIHPQYSLTVYGDGDQRDKLETLIKQKGLQQCVFLPGIEKDIFTRLQKSEIFAMSSNFEGMPNALIEAMAMGLPVISTDYSDGRGNLIENKRNGLLVPRKDSKALSEAMVLLIEHPKLKKNLATEAVKIREELDSKVICKKWLEAIEKTERTFYPV
jgi:glycosyltransferase involved in cell wall biosynthesis